MFWDTGLNYKDEKEKAICKWRKGKAPSREAEG